MNQDTKSDAPTEYETARASWGFPGFAKDFPRHPELDALVVAFARGNFADVRAHAPKLASTTDDDAVRTAASVLEARTKPDPSAKLLFAFAGALLAFLTLWWVLHDGPGHADGAGPAKVEKLK